MSEQTLTEALEDIDVDIDLDISDEDIERAALPEHKRVEEEVQDESTYIDLSEEEVEDISPVTEDEIEEDFEINEEDYAAESEADKKVRSAQDRINKAVRQAKEHHRRELQAVQYARQVQEENKKLSTQFRENNINSAAQNLQIQERYSKEFQGRIEAQSNSAKKNLQKAYESGDPEAMVEAQSLLARTESDRVSLNQYKQELEKYKEDYKSWADANVNVPQDQDYETPVENIQPISAPDYREPSEKAQEWAAENEWFGSDRIMTNVAFALHEELRSSGLDVESDEYYSKINERMREVLPNNFNDRSAGNSKKPVQTVVSGTRITGKGRNQNDRRIELSPSEQSLSKRLGVSFKEYARQKMRLQRS